MIIVLFEVTVAPGMRDTYLDLARGLREELERQDGFIALERSESLQTPDKLLSMQVWRDEEALAGWRQNESHQRTMPIGYRKVFADYRLRVLSVIRDYGKFEREEAPTDVARLQAPSIRPQ